MSGVVIALLAMTFMGCGHVGRKVAGDVGAASTPDESAPIRDVVRAASRQHDAVRPGIAVAADTAAVAEWERAVAPDRIDR